MMRLLVGLLAAIFLPAVATAAQAGPAETKAEPLQIVIPVIDFGCDRVKPTDDTIVVCGRAERRYRIDPTVLAVSRGIESRGGPRPAAHTSLFQERCGPVGGAPCAGQNTLPVSSIALTVTTALIKLVKGEDLRPMLHPVPSEYDLYQQAKAAEAAPDPRAPK